MAFLRPVLRRAEPELLYVPAAHAERHPQGRAICRRRRSRRALWRRLRACHHARQSADPRNRSQECGRHDRGGAGLGALLARLRRRQYPQRHRQADRRHRPAGTDRHAPLYARMALPHSQRPLALRPAAQVQRRLRRRRHHSGAGGYQRHRFPGRAGEGRLRPRSRRLVPALPRRTDRAPQFRRRYRRAGQAGRRHAGRRRGGARVHRSRRPHRPHQGAAQIRARQIGRRKVPRPDGGKARPQARPRRAGRARAAPAVFAHRASRHSRAEAAGPQLDRRRRAGRPADGRADEGACGHRARFGRRRYQAHGLAEPADFRRAVAQTG